MCIAISAFLAFHFESLAASDTTDVFFGIQGIAVVALDEIGCACFSPRNPIFLVRDRPDKEIQRKSDKRSQERDHDDADDLQTEAIGPIDDIFRSPDDCDNPQKNQEDRNDIYPESDTFSSKKRSKAPRRFIKHDTDSCSHDT